MSTNLVAYRLVHPALLVTALLFFPPAAVFAQYLAPFGQQTQPTGSPTEITDTGGRYIVTFARGVGRADRARIASEAGATVRYNYTVLNAVAIQLPNAAALNALRNNRAVTGIFPDLPLHGGAPPATPLPPSDLAIAGVTSATISLAWTDQSTNEEGFEVERCVGGSCSTVNVPPSAASGGTVNFTDAGLASSTTYDYRVRAFITSGPPSGRNSAYAGPVAAETLPAAPPPAAVTNLEATPAATTQIDLSWTDNAFTEDGFRVYRCTGSCTPTVLLQQIDGADVQAFSDITVQGSTTYSYIVRAFNAGGESVDTNIAEATTPDVPSVPGAPSGLLVTAVSASSVAVSWTDNASNENGFEIERCEGSGNCAIPFALLDTVVADQQMYIDSAVSSSTTYRYRVRAFSAQGFSAYTNIVEATTSPTPPPPPPPPTSLSGTRQVTPLGVQRVGMPTYLDDGTPVSDGFGIGVAVLDSGVDYNQPDLLPAPDNPRVTSFNAFNPGASCQDDRGHGTHVTGVIAAQNNNIGVVGVAPGATVYCVKVLDASGSGDESFVTAGLEWVAMNHAAVSPPIRVVNMSLGRPLLMDESIDPPSPMRQAIQTLYNLGITVVVSGGNDASLETTQLVPSAFPEVLAIGGTVIEPGHDGCAIGAPELAGDNAAFFTSDGAFSGVGITASAPSEERDDLLVSGFSCVVAIYGIRSTRLIANPAQLGPDTVITSRRIEPPTGDSGEAIGTSFAAPHVTGIVARILQLGLVPQSGDSLEVEGVRTYVRDRADRRETAPADPNEPSAAPLDNPLNGGYTFDGEREGIAQAPEGAP